MATRKPDFLLAEPVGSCTDLVATVLRPLEQVYPGRFSLAPFTVLVDPLRARDALSRDGKATLSEKVTYIYRLQQLEAEAIAINKIDMLLPDELAEVTRLLRSQFPGKKILPFSARSGAGFDELAAWLLGPTNRALPATPDIDYDVYAEGEAELAWFDGRFDVCAPEPIDMEDALLSLGRSLRERLSTAGLQIAHVKLLLRAGQQVCALSLPRNDAPPELSRRADGRASSSELIVNARVAAEPETLRGLVESGLQAWAESLSATVSERSVACFSPARPIPTLRIG